MTGMQGNFDANQFAPRQAGETHPIGKFPFRITNTEIQPNKENTGGYLMVEFTTQVGTIPFRYNLWNQNPKAVEIAHGQLSALCHAIGIFRLNYETEGKEIIGGQGQIDIGYQKGHEPGQPGAVGYTEIKKVYDARGNEPGKPPQQPAQGQQPPQAVAPMQQQPSGGWGAPPAASGGQAAPNQPQGWGGSQPQQPANQPPPQPPAQPWQQNQAPVGGAADNSPPWARR